jgi:hypothetical protein
LAGRGERRESKEGLAVTLYVLFLCVGGGLAKKTVSVFKSDDLDIHRKKVWSGQKLKFSFKALISSKRGNILTH